MEIKSSLLNSESMSMVKNSLIQISEIDHKEEFRIDMLEYINDTADNEDDEFFYDMLKFVLFLDPNDESVAYTDPNHLIWMNAPDGGNIGEKVRPWDFVYCHECMHQLWDTFGVGDRIKENGIKYNHYVLNIASDCVINDYLSYYRKKTMPDDLITPEFLKKEYDVDYNRKRDTQYTLYLKLIEKAKELEQDQRCQNQCGDSQEGQGGQSGQSSQGGQGGQGGQSGQSGQGGKGSQGGQSGQSGQGGKGGQGGQSGQSGQGGKGSQSGSGGGDVESADDAASRAQDAANRAQAAADEAKKNGDKDAAEKQKAADAAKEAAKEAKEAADKANKAAKNGDDKTAKEQADKARKAADKAESKAGEAGAKDGNGKDGKGGGKGQSKTGHTNPVLSNVDLEEIKKKAEATINKYKNKISGDIGKFIDQCQASTKLKENGLVVGAAKAESKWNAKLYGYTSAYIKNRVFQKHREYKRTYQRPSRRAGIVKFGEPLQKGKKIKDDKLIISVAFYIDRSGSMSGSIDDVFNASYIIANAIKRIYGRDKLIEDFEFKMFVFDTRMNEIKWGTKSSVGGGTMDLDELLKHIKDETNDYMINIIITDAEFGVNESKITDFLKDINGCIIFVTNNQTSEVKDVANKSENKLKLFYVQADANFTIEK